MLDYQEFMQDMQRKGMCEADAQMVFRFVQQTSRRGDGDPNLCHCRCMANLDGACVATLCRGELYQFHAPKMKDAEALAKYYDWMVRGMEVYLAEHESKEAAETSKKVVSFACFGKGRNCKNEW